MTKITIIQGDLVTIVADAIVNPANRSLLGGGGLDGAIHYAAGPKLKEECATLGGCEIGGAKLTKGYNLAAKYIIHTVGPMYGYEGGFEQELLQAAYKSCLDCAREYGLRRIAFPSISTGGFCYPKDEAAKIASDTVRSYIESHPDAFDEIMFVLLSDLDHHIFESVFNGKSGFTIDELHQWRKGKSKSGPLEFICGTPIIRHQYLMRAALRVLRGSDLVNDKIKIDDSCWNVDPCPEEYLKFFKNQQEYHAFNIIREDWNNAHEHYNFVEIGWLENKMYELKFIPARKAACN